jgi:hypothetical protein
MQQQNGFQQNGFQQQNMQSSYYNLPGNDPFANMGSGMPQQ